MQSYRFSEMLLLRCSSNSFLATSPKLRRSAGQAAKNSASRRMLYVEKFSIKLPIDKSKSSVQDTKSTRNRTSVFTTELNERAHESKQCIPSQFTHIELKVPLGNVFLRTSVFISRTTRGGKSSARSSYRMQGHFGPPVLHMSKSFEERSIT